MVCVLLLACVVAGGWVVYRSRHVSAPLLSAGVAIGADGERVALPPGGPQVPLMSGSRVLVSASLSGQREAGRQRAWLTSGSIPVAQQDMMRTALLDIDTLLLPDGAAVAGWPRAWRYVWPRDASMIAVALSRTGHRDDALKVMRFLQARLPSTGVFQARYLPDGSGVPDSRGEQTDGIGWVLWATDQLVRDASTEPERAQVLNQLRPLVNTSTGTALRITNRPGALPAPSQDYWEVHDDRLSLGTAAPLAFGLESAASLQRQLGNTQLATDSLNRAATLRASIAEEFGRDGYPRYLGDDKPDASVAFLLPPFTDHADPAIVRVWRDAARRMARPAGGLAPGSGWKNDGISWTPQTALFALTAASIGDRPTAQARLAWLDRHRTRYGALPEKVLHDGAPSGPAPLAWTDALVLLTGDALSQPPTVQTTRKR